LRFIIWKLGTDSGPTELYIPYVTDSNMDVASVVC